MMKKLAVTVFVVSLAAIGCGSDDGTPEKKDSSSPDSTITKTDGSATKLDVNVQTDSPMKMDTAPDMMVTVDQGIDMGSEIDGGAVDGGEEVDGGAIDGGDTDAPIEIDGGAVDVQPVDTGAAVDLAAQG